MWGLKKNRIWPTLVVVATILCILAPGPMPAQAGYGEDNLFIGATILGVIGTAAIGYAIYENLPSRAGKKRFLSGEFYAGGYLGGSFATNQDLKYSPGINLYNRTFLERQGKVILFNSSFGPSLSGGLKLGYFFETIPYLGLEAESNVTNSSVPHQSVRLSRPVQGFTRASLPGHTWTIWNNVPHIVGRYGFFRDKEVPFGRLQPYLGIGPGFVVIYEDVDSAKNFSLDVMAGVKYMVQKHFSVFLEYKFSQQWDVELEDHAFYLPNGTVVRERAYFDYSLHQFVLGVAYHW